MDDVIIDACAMKLVLNPWQFDVLATTNLFGDIPVSYTHLSLYCWNMARNAVHAAMAGNTEMLIGRWHGRFVHVPMPLATRFRKQVDTSGDLWMAVVESTGQPISWAS